VRENERKEKVASDREICRDVERCGEIWGDMGRDMGREGREQESERAREREREDTTPATETVCASSTHSQCFFGAQGNDVADPALVPPVF
jgi:hypothetical protein